MRSSATWPGSSPPPDDAAQGSPLERAAPTLTCPTTRALSESVYIRITFFSSRDAIAIVFFRFYPRSFLGEILDHFYVA
jgi:hypothetical protein